MQNARIYSYTGQSMVVNEIFPPLYKDDNTDYEDNDADNGQNDASRTIHDVAISDDVNANYMASI